MPFRDENRRKKASKTPESALRTSLPSKGAQQYMQVRTMRKEKGNVSTAPQQELLAQVENHTAARTSSDFHMSFVNTLGCLGHCFHAYPPNVLVSTIAE